MQELSLCTVLKVSKVLLYGIHTVSKSLSYVRMKCHAVRHNFEFSPLLAQKSCAVKSQLLYA